MNTTIPQHWQDWFDAAQKPGFGQAEFAAIAEHGRYITFKGKTRLCVQTPSGRWALPATAAGLWFQAILRA